MLIQNDEFVDPSICYMSSLFGGAKPQAVAQPAPLPTREDPAIKARADDLALAERRRRGRVSTIRTDQAALGTANVNRPEVRGATLLGQTSA